LEIVRGELRNRLQPLGAVQYKPPLPEGDQLFAPECLQDAVDVHRGQAQRISQLALRQWQLDSVALNHADRPQSPGEFAQEIGDAPACAAASKGDNSLAQHRILLPRAPP